MKKTDLILAEFANLRGEVIQRVKLLHLFILVAVFFDLVFLFMTFALIASEVSFDQVILFLLFAPVIFTLLTFNYQANQMTLEGAAGYIGHELKSELPKEQQMEFDNWDIYYDRRKRKYQLTSFLKVMPFLTPMTIPLWVYLFYPNYSIYPHGLMMVVDAVLFLLVIFNFRYKIGR